jgi:hypothetical protein
MVSEWLKDLGLGQYAAAFEENDLGCRTGPAGCDNQGRIVRAGMAV